MGETAFQKFPAPSQQLFSVLAANPPPVAVHRWLRLRFVLPTPPSTVRLRDVTPNFGFPERLQHVVAVITFVAYHLHRTFWVRSEEHTSELQSPCNLVCR